MAYQGFLEQKPGFSTSAIHSGQEKLEGVEPVVQPIVTAATFKLSEPGVVDKIYYGRCGNPNRYSLERCLATLEGGKHGFAFASGHGAMMTIFSLLSNGDHILSCDDIYAGTAHLFNEVIIRMGIEVTFADFTKVENVEKAIKTNTKMVWIETPTNPMLKVIDIATVIKSVKKHEDIMVGVDNTFLTSYFQKPLDFGADIVMYSLTKFMNGHSDVVMGGAVVNDDKIAERLTSLQMFVGAVPSPIDCYLVSRGLKTLALRMEQHKKTSLIIANWLLTHENVIDVLHPGLPTHPQHEIAKRQVSGHSGIFSFKHSGGLEQSKKFLCSLKIFILAVSLGGYESLAQLPYTMTHSALSEEKRAEFGITDSLIRLSVGLEDPEDLISDLDQALKAAFA
ncbi:cystathionine gamma-lyase-like [Anticarsia gemmatalis]|uniref:cystathionine gamma-lyase-like n=1 Tax=Anticarsia gemmatalis TaxID=129554 RepID=UPI003F763692